MQTEDLKESSKQTTAEETPQQEAQTNTADAANGVDETAGKRRNIPGMMSGFLSWAICNGVVLRVPMTVYWQPVWAAAMEA